MLNTKVSLLYELLQVFTVELNDKASEIKQNQKWKVSLKKVVKIQIECLRRD